MTKQMWINTGLLVLFLVVLSGYFQQDQAIWILLFGALFMGMLHVMNWRFNKLAEEKKITEQQFSGMVHDCPALIWTSDRDKRYDFVNNTWLRFSGLSLTQIVGDGWLNSIHPDDRKRCWHIYSTAFDQRQPFTLEARMLASDGEYRWIRSDGRPRYDSRNQAVFIGYIGYCMDISEIKSKKQQMRKLSLAVEQSASMIVITDINARIEYVNPAFLASSGYSLEEVIGNNPRILKSGKTPDATYAAMWQTLKQGQSWCGELINRCKDGKEYIEYAVISPLQDEDGPITHYVATKSDITELRRTTETLKIHRSALEQLVYERTSAIERQNKFMEDLIASIPCGVFCLRPIHPNPLLEFDSEYPLTFSVEFLGHRCQQLLGLGPNDVITHYQELIERFHLDTQEQLADSIATALKLMTPVSSEGSLFLNDTQHWIRVDLHPHWINNEWMLVGSMVDISDRMQRRDWLYRSAIELSPDAFIAIDHHDRILEWSIQAERLFGYKASEVIGQNLSAIIIPAKYAGEHDYHVRNFKGGQSPFIGKRIRLTAKNRGGVEFPIELQIMAQQIGKHWRFTSFVRDIREVIMAEQKMAQLEKLEAIGQLTGGLAHDFNNILGIIMGNLDLLRLDTPVGESRIMLDTALSAANRGAEITKSLLAVARADTLTPVVVDINKALTELGSILCQSAGKRVKIKTALCTEPSLVKLDIGGFNNAMINLFVNARDAMPDGGELFLYTYPVLIEAPKNREFGIAVGYYLVVGVDDTGMGMSQETINKAFDPFFTTKDVGKGTGLGLAMVMGFCQQSGGSAHIDSSLGKGSSVQLYLPLRIDAAETSRASGMENRVKLEKTGRVLVVDDEVDLARVIAYWLEDANNEVVIAESAQTALDQLERQHFDLLLSDIVMPGNLDGMGLARRVATDYPDLPIVLMSGIDQKYSGEWRFLQKPLNKEALFNVMNSALCSSH